MNTKHSVYVSKPAHYDLQIELFCSSQITKGEALKLLENSGKLPRLDEFVELIPLHCTNWQWVGSYWSIAYTIVTDATK